MHRQTCRYTQGRKSHGRNSCHPFGSQHLHPCSTLGNVFPEETKLTVCYRSWKRQTHLLPLLHQSDSSTTLLIRSQWSILKFLLRAESLFLNDSKLKWLRTINLGLRAHIYCYVRRLRRFNVLSTTGIEQWWHAAWVLGELKWAWEDPQLCWNQDLLNLKGWINGPKPKDKMLHF